MHCLKLTKLGFVARINQSAHGDTIWISSTEHDLVTAVDARTRCVTATIPLGLGSGGDIAYGDDMALVTSVGAPLTVIDARDNRPLVQWIGLAVIHYALTMVRSG